jgi:hypothetical protein
MDQKQQQQDRQALIPWRRFAKQKALSTMHNQLGVIPARLQTSMLDGDHGW